MAPASTMPATAAAVEETGGDVGSYFFCGLIVFVMVLGVLWLLYQVIREAKAERGGPTIEPRADFRERLRGDEPPRQ